MVCAELSVVGLMKCGWVWWTFYVLYPKVWLGSILEESHLKTENEAGVGF